MTVKESARIGGAVDGAIANYVSSVGPGGTYSQKDWGQCLQQCTCSIYSSVLEEVEIEKLNLEDKKIYRKVSSLARE